MLFSLEHATYKTITQCLYTKEDTHNHKPSPKQLARGLLEDGLSSGKGYDLSSIRDAFGAREKSERVQIPSHFQLNQFTSGAIDDWDH